MTGPRTARSGWTAGAALLVGVPAAVFAAAALFAALVMPYRLWDSLAFGSWSRSIAAGHGLWENAGPLYLQRPLFYVAQGLVWRVVEGDWGGRLLSLAFAAAFVLAVGALARRLAPAGPACSARLVPLAVGVALASSLFATYLAAGMSDVPVAALVAAAAGAGVAKHGNRAVSSLSGSADVLEALGLELEQPPERIAESIDRLGFGFMFAPAHHPAMRHAAPVRRELGTRTVFNLLGPLTNPAGARRQVVGVFSAAYVRPVAEALKRLGAEKALVVHGADGMDEITVADRTFVAEVSDGEIREYEISPEDFGLPLHSPDGLLGGDAHLNARILRDILAGEETGAARDVVLLNAAAAVYVSGEAKTIEEGARLARDSIESGAAAKALEGFVRATRRLAGTV
ncbi:MAG TPA: anthranilate phosphoribosyltransferase [Gaiellaceae bacterium]|nr:anthranilate phosphoribosyltransferase [Gaiellaceae bacterium]